MVPAGYNISDLQNLESSSPYYESQSSFTSIRVRALREAGEELGMQTALATESQAIDKILVAHTHQLDQIFDFRLLMSNDNVLPPVIISARNLLQVNDTGDDIRIGGQTYRLIEQVRFVTAAPTWRDYLWMNYPYPKYPNETLLPKTSEERQVWKDAVAQGWKEGIDQALSIYNINLDRLTRDFNGMILYRKLLAENMVSPFDVNKQDYGITGNGNQIVIDNQNWHIAAKPALQIHSNLWQPALATKPITFDANAKADAKQLGSDQEEAAMLALQGIAS